MINRKRAKELRDILKLLEKGETDDEIADKLGSKLTTIKRVRSNPKEYERKVRSATKYPNGIPADVFHREWTKAVNRIRRFYGKELFKER